MENKDKPAFACVDSTHLQEGLTKLEYFTAMAMQGILSNPKYSLQNNQATNHLIAGQSICLAVIHLEKLEEKS